MPEVACVEAGKKVVDSNEGEGESKKLKPCCACPETKQARDKCVIERGEENCTDFIEAHKECMRKLGFKVNVNERDDVIVQVKKHREEIDLNTQNFRKAILCCTQRIEKETRDALLEGSNTAVRQRVSGAVKLRDESYKATESLSSLVSQMNEEVNRSQQTVNSLVYSSDVLHSTDQEFSSMGATIQSSGRLLSKYSRRELTDKILITLAACLFFATAFYIVQKRLFASRFSFW